MINTSFHSRHMFLLSALSSQSHTISCLVLMSHHQVNNKCNRVKEWCWRWVIYALHNFLLGNKMLHVFRSNHHCSWKFHKFHRKHLCLSVLKKLQTCRPVLYCFFLYVIIHVYVKSYFCINCYLNKSWNDNCKLSIC